LLPLFVEIFHLRKLQGKSGQSGMDLDVAGQTIDGQQQ
jgi:hypothetical protein